MVAGIGGSYLGARAVIEALSPAYPAEDQVRIAYAGNSLSEDDMHDLLELLDRTGCDCDFKVGHNDGDGGQFPAAAGAL